MPLTGLRARSLFRSCSVIVFINLEIFGGQLFFARGQSLKVGPKSPNARLTCNCEAEDEMYIQLLISAYLNFGWQQNHFPCPEELLEALAMLWNAKRKVLVLD